jgi:hypothetical protein
MWITTGAIVLRPEVRVLFGPAKLGKQLENVWPEGAETVFRNRIRAQSFLSMTASLKSGSLRDRIPRMALNWPKSVMLWLMIATYSAQAIIGGSGWALCLGATHLPTPEALQASAHAVPTCDHGSCGEARIVEQHIDETEECPCTDISIDDSEPGRIEDQSPLKVAQVKWQHLETIAGPTEFTLARSAPATARQCTDPPTPRQDGPDVVRTIVLLI